MLMLTRFLKPTNPCYLAMLSKNDKDIIAFLASRSSWCTIMIRASGALNKTTLTMEIELGDKIVWGRQFVDAFESIHR